MQYEEFGKDTMSGYLIKDTTIEKRKLSGITKFVSFVILDFWSGTL